MGSSVKVRVALLAALAIAAGCRRAGDAPSEAIAPATTPVRVARVTRETVSESIEAPGRSVAVVEVKIRAPFAGTLETLLVSDGSIVRRGGTLGSVIARENEAETSGARDMLAMARSETEKRDAEHALDLARKNRVLSPLRSSVDGVVLSHAASEGDRLSEGQEIVSVAQASSIVFQADVGQSDIPRVRTGQPASVRLTENPQPLDAVVAAVLPVAATDLTSPVRIQFRRRPARNGVGLFGTARIIVGSRVDVPTVPDAALLRDDVTGTTRVAVVSADRHVHWIAVSTGVEQGGRTEIRSPAIADGTVVVVSGQVGLPEGSPVSIQP